LAQLTVEEDAHQQKGYQQKWKVREPELCPVRSQVTGKGKDETKINNEYTFQGMLDQVGKEKQNCCQQDGFGDEHTL